MIDMSPTVLSKRTGYIGARASTKDRLVADELMTQLKLKSTSQLIRYLMNEKAQELSIG